MADSFNKKEREKKRQKRKKDKAEKKERKKLDNSKPIEFMYLDENGHLTAEKPDLSLRKKAKLEDIEVSTRKQEKSDESKFTKAGVVKFFNTEKGYGFIAEKETGESYFVHADSLIDQVKDHDKVTFEIGKGPKGPIAIEVRILSE
ncbi:cold-shock protein [Lewinella cohaerens]|uniref:cold-shock protein n=1 Tax=Lewinella cohaerens TaxID=70995 RepID=UPI00035EC225|nr:cold shock domain-containing protein [Lewinella cohaerens]